MGTRRSGQGADVQAADRAEEGARQTGRQDPGVWDGLGRYGDRGKVYSFSVRAFYVFGFLGEPWGWTVDWMHCVDFRELRRTFGGCLLRVANTLRPRSPSHMGFTIYESGYSADLHASLSSYTIGCQIRMYSRHPDALSRTESWRRRAHPQARLARQDYRASSRLPEPSQELRTSV